jgi:glucose/arabinose dehydrogenase
MPRPRVRRLSLEHLEDRSLFAAGLVAAFGFDEGVGTTVSDASGLGNTGTISGATWTTAGRFGGALSFDGVDDWVTVADSASLDLTTGVTLEAWVRPTTVNNWRTVIHKETGGGLAYLLYAANDVDLPVMYVTTNTGNDIPAPGSSQLPVNTWTHLAGTYDGSTIRLYVNGALVGSRAATGDIVTSASPLRIGGNSVWGEFFQGQLDELRVYNRALSAAEITQDMNTPVNNAGTGSFQQTTVLSGLTNPTVVRFAPDGRVFVAEKSGIIKVFDGLGDPTPTIFADLRTNVYNAWDRGLLGMALDPNFATNPYVYVLYTYDAHTDRSAPVWGSPGVSSDPLPNPPGATGNGVVVSGRLTRMLVQANGTAGPEQVLIDKEWLQQFPSHSIGALQFGPDGALYASGGDGASFNYVDYGQTAVNVDPRNPATMGDPVNEGGALRSQDLRTAGDPVTLAGSVIRVNPATGEALPDNPLIASSDPNARRVIAYGLRNPFRLTFRPGTSELWLGDVGWGTWEEIDRIVNPTDGNVENFGWPAYEGGNRQSGYDSANLPLLEALYNDPSAHTAPYYAYNHSAQVVSGSGEPTGSSSIAGLAFYSGTSYPAQYQGALFFADYSRGWIWAMFTGANGLPDPSQRATFVAQASGVVNLEIGPNGDLFYVNFNDGTIRRLIYASSNRAPTAVATGSPLSGNAPLTVQFDGSGSSDPDPGTTLSYAWDLDGDGQFDDSTAINPGWTYSAAGNYTATLRVTDNGGQSDTDSVVVSVGNTAPTAIIDTPLATQTWQVGEVISFSGRATDFEQGTLPASALSWSLILHHGTHTHPLQSFPGVASGSFTAPDHELPAYLELVLTATDAGGLQSTASVRLDPRTVTLTIQSNPPGLNLTINGTTAVAPFTATVIQGSTNSLSAPPAQTVGGTRYEFSTWSDGGSATHTITAPASATYTASYTATTLIGSEGFGYRAYTSAFQSIDLVPGAPGVFTVRTSGDNNSTALNLAAGLTFNYYGTSYTRLYTSTNGLITFGSGSTSRSNSNLTSSPNQRTIAVLWDDWVNTSGNAMILGKYEDTDGNGVNDRLILEWNKVQGVSSSPSDVTFQAILSLNTGSTPGDIVLNYPDLNAGNSRTNGGSATVGIKNSGTQGVNRLVVSFNDGSGQYVASGKAVRFTYEPVGGLIAGPGASVPASGSSTDGMNTEPTGLLGSLYLSPPASPSGGVVMASARRTSAQEPAPLDGAVIGQLNSKDHFDETRLSTGERFAQTWWLSVASWDRLPFEMFVGPPGWGEGAGG